jgi:hypothetical protein
MYTHNRPERSLNGAPRAELTRDAYVRNVADKARARLAAADHAMRRLELKAEPHRPA